MKLRFVNLDGEKDITINDYAYLINVRETEKLQKEIREGIRKAPKECGMVRDYGDGFLRHCFEVEEFEDVFLYCATFGYIHVNYYVKLGTYEEMREFLELNHPEFFDENYIYENYMPETEYENIILEPEEDYPNEVIWEYDEDYINNMMLLDSNEDMLFEPDGFPSEEEIQEYEETYLNGELTDELMSIDDKVLVMENKIEFLFSFIHDCTNSISKVIESLEGLKQDFVALIHYSRNL